MRRAAWILLLLLVAWVPTLPGARLQQLRARADAPAATTTNERASALAEHVAARSATPRVARAPALARLPVAPLALLGEQESWERASARRPHDLREAVRRAQTRRRIPRLSAAEPPWS